MAAINKAANVAATKSSRTPPPLDHYSSATTLRLVVLRLLIVMSAYLPWSRARADDAEQRSRRAFEEGVALGAAAHWEQAAAAFESSLEALDRPATRFNLVVAYDKLAKPLEVARHALAFLRYPEDPAHADARAKVERALANATLDLSVITTDGLPETAELSIDGAPPVRDGRRVYCVPGPHHLELRLSENLTEAVDLSVEAGRVIDWPRSQATPVAAASGPAAERSPVRQQGIAAQPHMTAASSDISVAPARESATAFALLSLERQHLARERALLAQMARVLGGTGGLSFVAALAAYGIELRRAQQVTALDPFETGYLSKARGYIRAQSSVMALAIAGGILTTSAIALGPRVTWGGSRALSWSAFIAGAVLAAAGAFLIAREPQNMGDTEIRRPTRDAGALFVSAAAPVLGYAVRWRFSERRAQEHGKSLQSVACGLREARDICRQSASARVLK